MSLVAVFHGPASAINISDASAPVKYAAETLDASSTTAGAGSNAGITYFNIVDSSSNDLDVKGDLGIPQGEVFVGKDLYFRFDLENGVFSSAMTANSVFVSTLGTTDYLAQGGASGRKLRHT